MRRSSLDEEMLWLAELAVPVAAYCTICVRLGCGVSSCIAAGGVGGGGAGGGAVEFAPRLKKDDG